VSLEGSSTIYPITEAAAEEFMIENPGSRVTIGVSGTGGGFKKFTRHEVDITGASRPILKEEDEMCRAAKVPYYEIPIAYDGLVVVVHPSNDWVSSITVAELKRIWEPSAQGVITRWNQIRPEWPDKELHLFGAGTESGTFDYFTEAIVGTTKSCRGDYTASEDDNILVHGISMDKYALGFFGIAYLEENRTLVKAIPVDDLNESNGKGPILPTAKTILDGTYQPLSRPLFLYVDSVASKRFEVDQFIRFYLSTAPELVPETGFIPLSDISYRLIYDRYVEGKTGSLFLELETSVGVRLEDLLLIKIK
jgi:phosphate transport system substrate-binding protein